MSSSMQCECCSAEALPQPVHILNATHRFCRACYLDAVNRFVVDHRALADTIGRGAGYDWTNLPDLEVAGLIVEGIDQAGVRARALSATQSGPD